MGGKAFFNVTFIIRPVSGKSLRTLMVALNVEFPGKTMGSGSNLALNMWNAASLESPQSVILDWVTSMSLLSRNLWTGFRLKQLAEEMKRTRTILENIFQNVRA